MVKRPLSAGYGGNPMQPGHFWERHAGEAELDKHDRFAPPFETPPRQWQPEAPAATPESNFAAWRDQVCMPANSHVELLTYEE